MHAEHIEHNKDERTQIFWKIYLSLYWKGCVWEGDGDRTKTATYWSPTLLAIAAFLSRSPGLLNRGPWGPSLCWDMVLIPASSLQLIWTSCRRGYIIILRALNSNRRQSRVSPDIHDRMHLLFTQVHLFWLLIDSGSEVNMQQIIPYTTFLTR